MILRRIQVEGYKALRNPVELKDLGLGIHLIHGPNEIGKSTLMQAIARALFDRYNSGDQEIRALRPWGTELAPRVLLELESGGKRWRLEKKFLDEESSSLSEWTGSKFERVADSVKSDDKVRALMVGTASKSGASSLGNWGLARLLWMTQASSRLAAPALDESLRQHLLGVLGSAVLSDTEQRLVSKLDKAYDVYYTAAKQSEKKGSPLADARERLERAEELLRIWREKWDEVSRLNETALDSQARLSDVEKLRTAFDLQIKGLKTKAQEELELEHLLRLKDSEFTVLLGKWKALNTSLLEIQGLEGSIASHRAAMLLSEPKMAQVVPALVALEAKWLDATEKHQAAEKSAHSIAQEMAQAALMSDARALGIQAGELAVLRGQVVLLEKELILKKEQYASRKRPKEAEVQELRTWLGEIDSLRARITDLGIEVKFTPERADISIEWKSTEATESTQQTERGQALVFKSADQGELVIPGVGRIEVRSGSQDSQALKERLKDFEGKVGSRFSAYDADSLEELQSLLDTTLELKNQGLAASAALASALGSKFKTASDVINESDRIQSALSHQLEQLGLKTVNEIALSTPLQGLRDSLAAANLALEETHRSKSTLDAEVRSARLKLEELRKDCDSSRSNVELLSKQLEDKLAALGGRERLGRELSEAALEKTGLESERGALASKLPPIGARASHKLQALERARDEAWQKEETVRAEVLQASALLTSAEGQGYYSKLAAAEEERALAAELVEQRRSQAQGTRLLRSLAHSKREEMNSGLLAPIESAVVEIFNYVRGSAPGSPAKLSFGADLHDLGVRLPDRVERGSLDSLSLGTQEQAIFAIRIAFGELLATRGTHPEPQLIVLDDPLVNADPARQERALEILRRAGEKLQILILTARPLDYRALAPKEYDLSALKG